MRELTNSISSDGEVRRETHSGREYAIFPSIIAKEGVMDYPEFGRKEYLPAESLQRSADQWADVPITVNHPPDRGNGRTAQIPESYTSEVIGRLFNPEIVGDDRLRGEVWLDVEKSNDLGGIYEDIVNSLLDGEEVGVSTGYAAAEEVQNGVFDGESYDLIQKDIFPNHLSLLTPDKTPRMGPEDGVGAPRLNHVTMSDTPNDRDESQNPALLERARAFGAAFRESFGFDPGADVTTNAEDAGGSDGSGGEDADVESNSDGSEEAEADDSDEADAESTDSNTTEDAETDVADGDTAGSEDDPHDTMSDNDTDFDRDETIESLASDEDVPFDSNVLEEMTDEQILTISPDADDGDGSPHIDGDDKEEGVDEEDAEASAEDASEDDAEGGVDEVEEENPDADAESQTETENETETETPESPETPGDDSTETKVEMTVNELTERLNSLEEKLEETQKENEELREKVDPDVIQAKQARKQLAEATETDAEELAALPDETAINMAANLDDGAGMARANSYQPQQTQQQRPNMAGAPGPVSRTNTEEDEYTVGRDAYEQRQNGDS